MLARHGRFEHIYNAALFLAYQREVIAKTANLDAFFYPPPMLLPSVLISYPPFEWAFFVWTAGGMIAASWLLRRAGLSWPVIVLGLLSPASLWNTELGQVGVIGGAILLAGTLSAARSPLRAGGLLGLLVCKPQTGVMVPALLIGQRNWRALLGFGAVCLALLLATWLVFGPACWHAYLISGGPRTAQVMNVAFNPWVYMGDGVSVFWMMRSLGAGVTVAYAVQGICALLCMVAVVWLWRKPWGGALERVALTIFLALLTTPYGYGDDMAAFSWMLAALAEQRGWRIGILDTLFWIWPMACQIVAEKTGVLLTPLVVVLVLVRTIHDGRHGGDETARLAPCTAV